MQYILNQFNQKLVEPEDTSSSENLKYMTPIIEGTAKKKKTTSDIGVGASDSLSTFYDECVEINSTFNINKSYYVHCKIKRLISEQVFHVYLINYEDSIENKKTKKQYLKTISISGGDTSEWVDFEVVFEPYDDTFNCILFELQRTIEDYTTEKRVATIVYEELNLVNDIVKTELAGSSEITKLGVLAHSGLFMVINEEGIHVGKTGTYEVKNDTVTVHSFSVVSAASEDIKGTNPIRIPTTGAPATLEQYLNYIASLPPASEQETNSSCIFGNSKIRGINPFTIDYIFKREEE